MPKRYGEAATLGFATTGAVRCLGAVGVVATGVVVARQQRRRQAYTPEEIRSRLHERLAQAQQRAKG